MTIGPVYFAIFKTPRTGSSTLSEILNATDGVRCYGEVLNHWDAANSSQEFIQERLDESAGERCSILGYTLNPRKHDLDAHFYRFPVSSDGTPRPVVFFLQRHDVFGAAVSRWTTGSFKTFPNNRTHHAAHTILEFASHKREMPEDRFRKIVRKVLYERTYVRDFARTFAALNDADYAEISYEGLFQDGHPSLALVEEKLDIRLSREAAQPTNKILPAPEEWLTNYDALMEAASDLLSAS